VFQVLEIVTDRGTGNVELIAQLRDRGLLVLLDELEDFQLAFFYE
jgi:hypothetical protein